MGTVARLSILVVVVVLFCVPLCFAADYDCPPMDITGDCYVDFNDIVIMAEQWLDGPTCPADYADCDANELNACEVHLLTDYHNCGACGNSCADFPGTFCENGVCVLFECPDLWGNCDGDPNNGCEFNLAEFPNTCETPYDIGSISGDVGNDLLQYSDHGSMYLSVWVTEANPNTTNLSVRFQFDCPLEADYRIQVYDITSTGECRYDNVIMDSGCEPSYACLGWPESYGVDDWRLFIIRIEALSGSTCNDWTLTIDGNMCSDQWPLPDCPNGFADCDGLDYNGCEIDLLTDDYNCGECGNSCEDYPLMKCENGNCVEDCPGSWSNCDGDPNNGCETDLLTDDYNCGECGNSCEDYPDMKCDNGICVDDCPDTWANCDGDLNNGCETNLAQYQNTCSSAINIGSISGDTGSDVLSHQDRGNKWVKFLVREDDDNLFSLVTLSFSVALFVPPGADYDMCIYDSCGSLFQCFETFGDDGGGFYWNDTFLLDNSKWIWVEVKIDSGSSCDNWQLTISGNTL